MKNINAVRVVGFRATFWYAVYRFQLLGGIARRRTPVLSREEILGCLPPKALEWNPARRPAFFFGDLDGIHEFLRQIVPDAGTEFASELDHIQKGFYRLWEDARHELGFPPDWNRNPLTGRSLPADRHWTEVDENVSGDIKGVWELSRFSLAFRLARVYAATGDERAPELFWKLVESWLEANPPNAGPQWSSSQEVALRSMAWIFALHAFARSPATTSVRTGNLIAALDAHAHRIDATLAYAKAQNNNHLISEAAGLFTIGLMFPDLPDAARWEAKGRGLLEGTTGQFFPDGGYIQHSHNYHRLALQLYAWAMRLAEINGKPFSGKMDSCIDRSLDLLGRLVDPATGRIPNFGHNDGALFLPLNDCGYEDFRPLLQTLSLWRKGARIWTAGSWDEDADWLLGPDFIDCAARLSSEEIADPQKSVIAPRAGLFLLPGRESRAVIRCARFHERPAHADQLHVDLWWRGENIACDAGSYLYGGDSPWRNALTQAALHNTVTIDGQDQMKPSGRFGWATLAQGNGEFTGKDKWQGSHDGYHALGVTHRRMVERMDDDVWIVTDDLIGQGRHTVRLHWLLPDYPWEWSAPDEDLALQNLLSAKMTGWKDGSGCGLILRTPAGAISLRIWSSRTAKFNLYRAGEKVNGEDAVGKTISPEIRGWRSLRYASKSPALSLAGIAEGELLVRFISVWTPLPKGK